jgi:chromosome segregation ATPase
VAVDDVNQVLLDQLRLVATEVQRIPQVVEQLKNISTSLARLERNDEEQGRVITDLKMSEHRFDAALTILSGELKQLAREVDTIKQEVMPLNTFIQKINTVSIRVNKFDDVEKEINDWRPWLRSLKWAATIAGAALVMAIVYAVFWAIQNSGALVR